MKYIIPLTIGLFLFAFPVRAVELEASQSAQIPILPAPDTPINLTVSPVSLSLETDPGVPVKSEIKVRNNSTSSEQLQITIGTFVADSNGDKPKLLDAKPADTFIPWLSVDPEPFVLNPGEWKTMPVSFSPPKEASLSYYYTIQVRRTSTIKGADGKAIVSGVPAILVLATVNSPDSRRELQLDSFVAKSPFLEFLPQEFVLSIKNSGNVHIAPTGNIFIDGQGKKDLAVLSFNPGSSVILPQTTRQFPIVWDDGFPVRVKNVTGEKDQKTGDEKQAMTLEWNPDKVKSLRFGKYTAHLIMVYDNGERDVPIESTVSFWVIPVRIIIAIIAVPTLPTLLVYLIMRRRMRKLQAKATVPVVILCIGVACLFAPAVHAQEPVASASAQESIQILPVPDTPINLTVSPVSLSLETDPAVPVKSEIKIRNNATSSEQLQVTVGTFIADESGDKPKLLDPKPTDAFISWMHVDPAPFVINPGEWKTMSVEFTPPKEASLSYYYTIMVKRTSTVKGADGKAVVSGVPAILVLATVNSPDAVRQLEVESFTAKHAFLEYLPEEFEVTLKNTGNVHLSPSGNIFLDGQGKKDLAVLSLNPASSLVLPGTSRKFTISYDDGFPVFEPVSEAGKDVQSANGQQERKLKWDFSKADRLRIGKFTAHLLMVYDNGERDVPVESYVSFWIIPWKLLCVAILIMSFALFGLYSIVRTIVRAVKAKKKVSQSPPLAS